jgi:hypothetical protein
LCSKKTVNRIEKLAPIKSKKYVSYVHFLDQEKKNSNPVLFVQNSGIKHGRLVRRNRIPKTAHGDFWHWKDFNIGINVTMYGVVYHITDCDIFTKVSI